MSGFLFSLFGGFGFFEDLFFSILSEVLLCCSGSGGVGVFIIVSSWLVWSSDSHDDSSVSDTCLDFLLSLFCAGISVPNKLVTSFSLLLAVSSSPSLSEDFAVVSRSSKERKLSIICLNDELNLFSAC